MSEFLTPPAPLWICLALPVAFGVTAFGLRWVRRSGALVGIPLGAVVLWLGGLGGFMALLAFFLVGTGLTRFGYARKEADGVAEEAGGRRGASHAVANCGVALLLLLARAAWPQVLTPNGEFAFFWVAYVGSFAAAASDTASSELGQLYGRHPISPRTLRSVPIGTPGAVSLEGLLAGLLAAAVLAATGASLGMYSFGLLPAVAAGGFLGNFLESLAGALGRKLLPHGGLNFANTAVGAGASYWIARLLAQ